MLDIEKDITEQGFLEGDYDLIIAAGVLHATHFLDAAMKNVRKLLRPGGYLVLMEITEVDWLRTSFMRTGIPSWWHGAKDGRQYNPTMPKSRWEVIFRSNGFSGIDTSTPSSKKFSSPYSVMVTQAIDTQIELIRQPLGFASTKPLIENLLIVGCQQLVTYETAEAVQTLIEPYCGNISIVERLEDLTEANIFSQGTVLCLSELEEPFFKPFTEEKYKALQNLTENSYNILWVVKGAQGENPYARMMFGVSRCLAAEVKESLRFQIIDADLDVEYDPKFLAETLLRMHIYDRWKNSTPAYEPLWPLETEMYVQANGKIQVPRYKPSALLDERYNSTRRVIKSERTLDRDVVEIIDTQNASKYEIQEILQSALDKKGSKNTLTIRIKRSVLQAIKVKSVGFLYILIGIESKTQRKVLASSESQQSIVSVPEAWVINCGDISDEQERNVLLKVANKLLADSVLGKSSNGSNFLIHEPTPFLAQTITNAAQKRNIKVSFTSSHLNDQNIRYVHPVALQYALESYIPKEISVFVDLSTSTDDAESTGARIRKLLPGKCKCRDSRSFFSSAGFACADTTQGVVSQALGAYYNQFINDISDTRLMDSFEDVSLRDISSFSTEHGALCTVNWTTEMVVPVNTVLAQDKVHFPDNRTYWMIGATGELGLSTCRWMIERGAKYFVLSSRNPNIDPDWLNAMGAMGVTVKVLAMDITSRPSVMGVYKKIKETLPPIAGVANAAMILSDSLLSNMSFETFQKTIRPKVIGTSILSDIFQKDDLDFFIIFSSLTYLAGNAGQTPYAAANAFMAALADQRRRRGLVASVMNLSGIAGLGYIDRTDKTLTDRLMSRGFPLISEWDFHQCLAEAVIASRPDSGRNGEVSNDIREADPEKETNPPWWINIPRLSHYRVVKRHSSSGKMDKGTVSIRGQLKEQKTEEGVRQVLLGECYEPLFSFT